MTIPFDPIAHAQIARDLYAARVRRVARAAGVCHDCIFKWLNGHKAMRPATFNMVMLALRQIGPYVPANPKQSEYNRIYHATVQKKRAYLRSIGQAAPPQRPRPVRAGERYGRATVLRRLPRGKRKARTKRFRCQCDCGRVVILTSTDLRTGRRAGCWTCANMKRYTEAA